MEKRTPPMMIAIVPPWSGACCQIKTPLLACLHCIAPRISEICPCSLMMNKTRCRSTQTVSISRLASNSGIHAHMRTQPPKRDNKLSHLPARAGSKGSQERVPPPKRCDGFARSVLRTPCPLDFRYHRQSSATQCPMTKRACPETSRSCFHML